MWDAVKEEYLEIAKAEGREKLISLIVHIRRVTSNQSSKFHLKKLGKVKQIKYKVSRRKEITKVKKINNIEETNDRKINKAPNCFSSNRLILLNLEKTRNKEKHKLSLENEYKKNNNE